LPIVIVQENCTYIFIKLFIQLTAVTNALKLQYVYIVIKSEQNSFVFLNYVLVTLFWENDYRLSNEYRCLWFI